MLNYCIFNEHGDVTQLWSQDGTCKSSYEYATQVDVRILKSGNATIDRNSLDIFKRMIDFIRRFK
jgi:hypothetical protein